MKLKRRFALLAVLIFCCGLFCGCGEKRYDTIVTIDGTPVGAGLYRLFQIQAYSEAAQKVTGGQDNLFSQTLDGLSVTDWIGQRTVSLLKSYLYYEKEFDANKLAFTQTELDALQAQIVADWQNVSSIYERNGVGETDFYSYDLNTDKAQKLFELRYADQSDEQIRRYLDDNFARISYAQLPLIQSTGSAMSEETAAEIDAAAAKALTAISSGADFADTVQPLIVHSYARAGFTVDESAAAGYIRTSYLNLFNTSDTTSEKLAQTVAATVVGECGIFRAEGLYDLIFRRLANYADEQEFAALRSSVLYEMKGNEFSAEMQSACADYVVVENTEAMRYYAPDKLDLSSGGQDVSSGAGSLAG